MVKKIIGSLITLASAALGLYVGLFLMIVKPIMGCLDAYSVGMLTAFRVFKTVVEVYFGGSIGVAIFTIGLLIGAYFWRNENGRE